MLTLCKIRPLLRIEEAQQTSGTLAGSDVIYGGELLIN